MSKLWRRWRDNLRARRMLREVERAARGRAVCGCGHVQADHTEAWDLGIQAGDFGCALCSCFQPY